MLARIVIESLTRRRRRKLLSVLAVTLGMAVTAAVGTIALDVGDKVGRELRSFGANIAVTPAADGLEVAIGGVDYRPAGAGEFLPEARLVNLKKIFWRNNIVAFAPFLYVPVKVQGRGTILTGSWLQKTLRVDKSEVFVTGLEKLHPTWKVQGQWPAADDAAGSLVGRRLAEQLGAKLGQALTVEAALESARSPALGRSLPQRRTSSAEFVVRGILETGGPEDDGLLAPLAAVQRLSGLEGKVRRVEVSALTKPEDAFARSDITRLSAEDFDRWYCSPYVTSIAYQIQQAIPESEAKPVYQVVETEGRVLDRVGILMALLAAAALVTAALAVASMMLATVLERRTEIGLFKALGATNARVAVLFLLEACAVGLVGGVAGYIVGSFLAWRLGLSVFGAPVGVHWVVFPVCVGLALLVSLSGSAAPLGRVLKISPATVLRD
jgi:putative ABC transport system permease protein